MAEHIQIGDVAPRIQYTGDGSQTVFTYTFPIFAAADMEVYFDQAKQSTGFTVNGAGQSAGGDVTFDAAPASGVLVTLRRRLAIQRTSDFQESGEFRAKVINDELDYLTAALQQVSDDGERALRLGATDPTASLTLPDKATRASMYLGFDAAGDAIATDASGPQGPTGPAGNMDGSNNLSELTNAATARANLGLGTAATKNTGTASGDVVELDATGLPAVNGSQLTKLPGDNVARANIVLNAFNIQIQHGLSVLNMVDGFTDQFEDATGIDGAASTNENHSAGRGTYAPTTINISSVSAHWAGATADFTFGTGTIDKDNTNATGLHSKGATDITFPGDFVVQWTWTNRDHTSDVGLYPISEDATFNSAAPDGYRGNMQAMTNSWRFETDGPSSTVIYHVATSKATPTVNNGDVCRMEREFDTIKFFVGGSLVHTFAEKSTAELRLVVGSNAPGDSLTSFTYPGGAVNNMTLVSNAVTAAAQPGEAFIVVHQEDIDAVTLNTDITAEVSRDGGTTWTAITLAEEAASFSTAGRILSGTADISAQPAGTSMKYRIKTLNAKDQYIRGVSLQWS